MGMVIDTEALLTVPVKKLIPPSLCTSTLICLPICCCSQIGVDWYASDTLVLSDQFKFSVRVMDI